MLTGKSFGRNVSILIGGTASAQLITVFFAPLLTRLFTPHDFGNLAVFVSLLGVINVISSLRYELAIPLPEKDTEAANVAAACIIFLILITLLSTVMVGLFAASAASIFSMPALKEYLWLLPLGVFLSSVYNIFYYWSIRKGLFTDIASTRFSQCVVMLMVQFSTFKLGGLGLIVAQVVGQSVGVMRLARVSLPMQVFKGISWRRIKHVLVRYRRFPLLTTWAGIFSSGGKQLPPLLFAYFFSPAVVGIYSLAYQVLTQPISMVGNSIQGVFFSGAAELNRNKLLDCKVYKLLDTLVQISVPPAVIMVLAGPQLFETVFGGEWIEAGRLARWMTPWLIMQFCTGPLTVVFSILEKQHIGLAMQAQLFCVRMIMILIGLAEGNLIYTVMLFSFGSAFSYSIFLYKILDCTNVKYC